MITITGLDCRLNAYFNFCPNGEQLWPTEDLLGLPALDDLAQCKSDVCFLPPHFFGAVKDSYPSSLEELTEQENLQTNGNGRDLNQMYFTNVGLLREYLAERSQEEREGISYWEAKQLRSLMVTNEFTLDGINRLHRGFWNNVASARNMFYTALDDAHSDIKNERINYLATRQILEESLIVSPLEIKELNSITERLANLIRVHILEKDGGSERFIERSRLKGLVNSRRDFLLREGSFGALLRCFIPGIVDEYNKYALKPHEVEQAWWDNEDYSKRQVFRKLCKLEGFKDLLDDFLLLKIKEKTPGLDNNETKILEIVTSEIADIIRKEILNKPGRGDEYLKETRLFALVHKKRSFLDKEGSFGAVIRRFLPGVIDENNENVLQPHEVEQDYWNDKSYAQRQVFRKLGKLSGFKVLLDRYLALKTKQEREELDTDETRELNLVAEQMAKKIEKEILEKPGGGNRFLDKAGLSGLVDGEHEFLDKKGSLTELVRCFLPEVARFLRKTNL